MMARDLDIKVRSPLYMRNTPVMADEETQEKHHKPYLSPRTIRKIHCEQRPTVYDKYANRTLEKHNKTHELPEPQL